MRDLARLILEGDLEAARGEARALIREILENDAPEAVSIAERQLAIIGVDGSILFSMSFKDALH